MSGELIDTRAGGNTAHARHLVRARTLATLMDSSIPIPGTGRKIGLDPLLGLVPFVGDFTGALVSVYIVLSAARGGVPAFTLIRMLGNVALDTLAGSVPILGDLFDAGWKSNLKNVALFERHLAADPGKARTAKQVTSLGAILMIATALLALALLTFVAFLVYLGIRHGVTGK